MPVLVRGRGVVPRGLAGAATFVLFTSGVIHRYRHWGGQHYDDGLVGVLGENAYVLGCLALLVLTPVRGIGPRHPTWIGTPAWGDPAPTVAV
jgi:hypothetical protein